MLFVRRSSAPKLKKNWHSAGQVDVLYYHASCKVTKLECSELTHLSETKVMRNHGVEFPATKGNTRKFQQMQHGYSFGRHKLLLQSVKFEYLTILYTFHGWFSSIDDRTSIINVGKIIKECWCF